MAETAYCHQATHSARRLFEGLASLTADAKLTACRSPEMRPMYYFVRLTTHRGRAAKPALHAMSHRIAWLS
jgi:hypothetical protein